MKARRRIGTHLAVIVGLAGPVGWSARASAEDLLVLPYQPLGKSVSQDLAEQATVIVVKQLEQLGLSVKRAEDLGGTAKKEASRAKDDAVSGDPSAGTKAEQLIAKAKRAADDAELGQAIKDLKAAIKLLEENGEVVRDLRLLPEAYLQLGAAYFRDGNEDQGDEMLAKAVHLDPDRQLDDAHYPNLFVRVYARARFNVLRRPRATLELHAPKGVQVLLDGRALGKGSLLVKDALPGQHWVRVERAGEPPQVKRVALKAGKTVMLELDAGGSAAEPTSPVGALAAVAENDLTRDHVAQVKEAGARAKVKHVLLGGIFKTDTAYNLRTLLISASDGAVGRVVDVAFDLDMLSAEIEAFKFAEDAKKQITGPYTAVVTEAHFPVASGQRSSLVRRDPREGEARVLTVVGAPPAPPPPEEPVIGEAKEDTKSRAIAGRAPLASGKAEFGVKVARAHDVVPKDEEGARTLDPPVVVEGATATVVPADEQPEAEKGSRWWLWVLVGVAAVGAASAGGYLVASGRSPDEGNLKISW